MELEVNNWNLQAHRFYNVTDIDIDILVFVNCNWVETRSQ